MSTLKEPPVETKGEIDCQDGHCRKCGTCCIVLPALVPSTSSPNSPPIYKPAGVVCQHLQETAQGKCVCLLHAHKGKNNSFDRCHEWNATNLGGLAYDYLMLTTIDWICNPTSPEQVELIRKHIARGGLPLELPSWLVSFQTTDPTLLKKTYDAYIKQVSFVPPEIKTLFEGFTAPSSHAPVIYQ